MIKKVKYQGGLTKKACMYIAALERKKFSKLIWSGELKLVFSEHTPSFDIVSFSGIRDLEEQFLSILSFAFHVGVPVQWTIYSDGSYTSIEKDLFIKYFPFVKIKEWNNNESLENNLLLSDYMKVCPLSKKLHSILGHDYQRQTMYADSDIVFYKNASYYFNSELLKEKFWYIPDSNWGSFQDPGVNQINDMFSLNSGLLILNQTFNFEDVYEYLKSLNHKYGYFSEQSSFNYSFKKQQTQVLDPRQFIIHLGDQFSTGMIFEAHEMAVRHYVTPVRHKMWQKGWKWHLRK